MFVKFNGLERGPIGESMLRLLAGANPYYIKASLGRRTDRVADPVPARNLTDHPGRTFR
ncbi:hypothetical protein DESC_710113 [Desulfosarcina cetonica]|nr:hypothetical protein DESC_710113 [Desulfosarcina cetonica]